MDIIKEPASQQKEIEALQAEIQNRQKRLNELRRSLPAEEVRDYSFTRKDGSEVMLSQLFRGKDELILVHNMGKSCPYCTLWADGFNGLTDHLNSRAPFYVESPDKHNIMQAFADGRGWKFDILSSAKTSLKKDLGVEDEDGNYLPGFSILKKGEDGRIYRTAFDTFGPFDAYCAVWPMFNLLPKGVNGWTPKYSYNL